MCNTHAKERFVNKWLPVLVSDMDGVGSLRNETHMRYSVTTNITCRTWLEISISAPQLIVAPAKELLVEFISPTSRARLHLLTGSNVGHARSWSSLARAQESECWMGHTRNVPEAQAERDKRDRKQSSERRTKENCDSRHVVVVLMRVSMKCPTPPHPG